MALVMVQGHTFDSLLTPEAQGEALYRAEVILHGSTAPGFLFASGFVAGLPRAPLSLRATLRRARRLLFVLGVGYALHLPYFSLWKTTHADAAAEATLFACDALQVIAVTQLFVLVLQWVFGPRWTVVTGVLGVAVLAAGPWVWAAGFSRGVSLGLGAYLDQSTGSHFPIFPFASFVLAGTVAGAALGRQEVAVRQRRGRVWGAALVAVGIGLSLGLGHWVAFWGVSPGYAVLRLGGLLLLLSLVEQVARRGWRIVPPLALLGHETLLVFVFHLYLLFGSVVAGRAPLEAPDGAPQLRHGRRRDPPDDPGPPGRVCGLAPRQGDGAPRRFDDPGFPDDPLLLRVRDAAVVTAGPGPGSVSRRATGWRTRALAALGEVDGLVAVLMKRRNGESWTAEDRRFLRDGLQATARYAPLALLLLLPGSLLMLPACAWLLDRRRSRRGRGGPIVP